MARLTNHIKEQRDAGLISSSEARDAFQTLAKQARFNADYSDSPCSYNRWNVEAIRAALAANQQSITL